VVDRRHTPNMWEYFKHPERYPAMHQTYGTPMPRTQNGEQPGVAHYLDVGRGARPLPAISDDEDWLRQKPVGPGGVVDAPWALPRAPHMTLAQAAAAPVPQAGRDARPALFGMGPGQRFVTTADMPSADPNRPTIPGQRGHFDAGVAPNAAPPAPNYDNGDLAFAFRNLPERIAIARAQGRTNAANAQAAHRDTMANMGGGMPMAALIRALLPRL